MADIIDFIAELKLEKIPEKAVQIARLCLLDAVGCMAGGIHHPSVFNLAQTISGNNPGSTAIVGTSFTTTRPWASFVNTHACTFFDLDDGHRKAQGASGRCHYTPLTYAGCRKRLFRKELLTAVVAGYETAVRSALIMRTGRWPPQRFRRLECYRWHCSGRKTFQSKKTGFAKRPGPC